VNNFFGKFRVENDQRTLLANDFRVPRSMKHTVVLVRTDFDGGSNYFFLLTL
jgi:hypothetical protein